MQVLEWQEMAAKQAKADAVLRVLRKWFPPAVPADVEQAVQAASSLDQLNSWLEDAAGASSLAEFRREAGLVAQQPGRRKRIR
jgi:hypothetical protein